MSYRQEDDESPPWRPTPSSPWFFSQELLFVEGHLPMILHLLKNVKLLSTEFAKNEQTKN